MEVKVTISRLHKLVERLKARIGKLNAEAATALGQGKNWRVSPTDESLQRVRAGTAAGLAAANEAIRLAGEMAKVRGIISSHNERLGVSVRLAQIDGLNVQLTQLKNVLATSGAHTSIEELPAGSTLTGDYGVTTGVLFDTDRTAVTELMETLQRDAYRLSDEVAEANATRVAVELDESIAALVTA